MAHPYAHHKEYKAAKHRVHKIMKSGGVAHHSDEKADKKLFGKLIHEHESKMHKGKSHPRMDKFARGGRTKAKGHVHINILNAPHGASPTPSPMGLTGAAPPPGAMGPPIAPPPGAAGPPFPPPAAAGMGPPMPHKRGGRANGGYIEGESNGKNLKKWAGYASKNSPPKKAFAHGGKAMPPKKQDPSSTWSAKQGGSEKTTKPGKLLKGKSAGQGSGTGLLEYARNTKRRYP